MTTPNAPAQPTVIRFPDNPWGLTLDDVLPDGLDQTLVRTASHEGQSHLDSCPAVADTMMVNVIPVRTWLKYAADCCSTWTKLHEQIGMHETDQFDLLVLLNNLALSATTARPGSVQEHARRILTILRHIDRATCPWPDQLTDVLVNVQAALDRATPTRHDAMRVALMATTDQADTGDQPLIAALAVLLTAYCVPANVAGSAATDVICDMVHQNYDAPGQPTLHIALRNSFEGEQTSDDDRLEHPGDEHLGDISRAVWDTFEKTLDEHVERAEQSPTLLVRRTPELHPQPKIVLGLMSSNVDDLLDPHAVWEVPGVVAAAVAGTMSGSKVIGPPPARWHALSDSDRRALIDVTERLGCGDLVEWQTNLRVAARTLDLTID